MRNKICKKQSESIIFDSNINTINKIKRKKKFKNFLILGFLSFFFFATILYLLNKYNLLVPMYNSIKINIISSKINLTNILFERINDTYRNNEFVNINEIESKIPGGRPWIKGQNKTREINIGIGIDPNYTLQAMMTISSAMDSIQNETKLRIHIGVVDGFPIEKMIKIYALRERIRNDVEFNFYNAKRVETELKGVHTKGNGVMAKLVLPILLPNDVERIIILDTGDLLVLRDLSEMYNWDMKNKTICGVIDPGVMKYGLISKKKLDIYINGGHFLVDVQKFKNDKIYERTVENKNIYKPTFVVDQNFLNDVAYGKMGYLPMKFGIFSPFNRDRRSDTPPYITGYNYFHNSNYHEIYPFVPKNRQEMNIRAFNPVIIHGWNGKWSLGKGLTIYRRIAQYYIKYAGIWDEMCIKKPGYCKK